MSAGREVTYSRNAVKALKAIDSTASKLIRAKVVQYAADPLSLANQVIALKGSEAMRLRIGDYRVIFTATLEVVAVIKVGHRREVYD